jgi:hypothetical protein
MIRNCLKIVSLGFGNDVVSNLSRRYSGSHQPTIFMFWALSVASYITLSNEEWNFIQLFGISKSQLLFGLVFISIRFQFLWLFIEDVNLQIHPSNQRKCESTRIERKLEISVCSVRWECGNTKGTRDQSATFSIDRSYSSQKVLILSENFFEPDRKSLKKYQNIILIDIISSQYL